MTHLRFILALALTMAPVTACSAQPADPPPEARTPASVMSYRGASWLERPERAAEDRPEIVLAAMNLENGDVVAEVGAGTGFFTRRLAAAVAPDGKVVANDIQPEMLELMKDYLERDGITNVERILGHEDDPLLPDNAFDWILLVDVYHEFQQPGPMLAGIRKALKPHGRVALVEYRAEGSTAAHVSRRHRMSKEQVLSEWQPAGFEVIEIIEDLPSQHLFIFKLR